MSNKNSKARKKLEKIYGKGCFMERAGIRQITGFRKDAYTMTYHHMRHVSEGGKATVENGANLALENHEFLHSLPREEEEKINNRIRQWKANFLLMNNGKVENSGSLEFPDLTNEENCIIIKLEDTTREQYEELQRQKQQRKQKFNRSKIKRETQQMIDELFYEDDEEFIEEEDER